MAAVVVKKRMIIKKINKKEKKNINLTSNKEVVVIELLEKYQKHIIIASFIIFTFIMLAVMHPSWFG